EVWALIGTLAKNVGASERTVQSAMRTLKERGFVEETGRRHKHLGGRWVPIYRIVVSADGRTGAAEPAPVTGLSLHPALREDFHPHMKGEGKEETSEEVSFESEAF